jgi:hypothetical protein
MSSGPITGYGATLSPYERERWDQYMSPAFREETLRFAELTRIGVDTQPLRLPFLLRGPVADGSRKVLFGGVAPYSRGTPPVYRSAEEWRAANRVWGELRQLHRYATDIAQAALGESGDRDEWARAHYLAIDLIPYHVPRNGLTAIRLNQPEVFALVKRHNDGWAEMVEGEDLALTILAGADWQRALIDNATEARLFGYAPYAETSLIEFTRQERHAKVKVNVGELDLAGRRVPTAVIPHQISAVRFGYAGTTRLGNWIRQVLDRGASLDAGATAAS